jgi:hypothetical protein
MIDESCEFGARVARHLREEIVVWLTTVTPSGAPLPRPVGFVWDGGVDESGPSAVEDAAFAVKYAGEFERFEMTAESYAERFSVPVRIHLTAVDGR